MRRALALAVAALTWIGAAPKADALGCIIFGCDCNVSASDLTFDAFNPLAGGVHDAVARIDVSCTGLLVVGAGVVVELDDGVWGAFSARKMRSAAGDLLDYNIYTNVARTTVWGDGTGGSQSVQINGGVIVLGGWSASRDMFGRMTATAATKPGAYSDTIVVRVIW